MPLIERDDCEHNTPSPHVALSCTDRPVCGAFAVRRLCQRGAAPQGRPARRIVRHRHRQYGDGSAVHGIAQPACASAGSARACAGGSEHTEGGGTASCASAAAAHQATTPSACRGARSGSRSGIAASGRARGGCTDAGRGSDAGGNACRRGCRGGACTCTDASTQSGPLRGSRGVADLHEGRP